MQASPAADDVPPESEGSYERQDLACFALLALPLRLSRVCRANTHLTGYNADYPNQNAVDCHASCSDPGANGANRRVCSTAR